MTNPTFSAAACEAAIASAVCRFTAFAPLSKGDIADLITLADDHREIARGETVADEGEAPVGIYLLIAGWTASSIGFADGRRQLIKIHLPGDLLGLPSIALRRAADSIIALTPAVIAPIPRAAIGRLFESSPRLAALLFLIAQEERVVLMDRLASIGATGAINRLAALLLQIHARLLRSQPETGNVFDIPLLQTDVADMIGVTKGHLNRTAQGLRALGAIAWERQRVTVFDFDALERLAELPKRMLAINGDWLPKAR